MHTDSRDIFFVPTPRLHGYDFSYQGLLGIWHGFQPSPQQLPAPTSTPPVTVLDLPPSAPHGTPAGRRGYRQPPPKRRALSPSDEIHGDFHAAIVALSSRQRGDPPSWRPTVPTHKLEQRQFALQLCGWSLKDEDLYGAIKRSICSLCHLI